MSYLPGKVDGNVNLCRALLAGLLQEQVPGEHLLGPALFPPCVVPGFLQAARSDKEKLDLAGEKRSRGKF